MKQVVDEFEAAMAKMIDDSRQEKERHAILMEKMADERNRVQTELKTVENAFKDHRVRYEEMKMLNEQYRKNETMLRQTIEKLQQDVKSSEQRVNAVKDHAEKKLKEYVKLHCVKN
jgi:chromosome segregation ATPase